MGQARPPMADERPQSTEGEPASTFPPRPPAMASSPQPVAGRTAALAGRRLPLQHAGDPHQPIPDGGDLCPHLGGVRVGLASDHIAYCVPYSHPALIQLSQVTLRPGRTNGFGAYSLRVSFQGIGPLPEDRRNLGKDVDLDLECRAHGGKIAHGTALSGSFTAVL